MRSDQIVYIRSNIGKKSIKQISADLGVKEREVRRFIERERIDVKKNKSTRNDIELRPPSRFLIIATIIVVALLTAAVFLPSLSNNFVEWDDPEYVYENPFIREFSISNLNGIFTQSFQGAYCPLTILSYAVEHRFFGDRAFIYHLTNYVLHIMVTLLVLLFIYSLGSGIIVAGIVSLLFGIHPLHVESVAWIAERKDVLYALFYILAAQCYVLYLKKNSFFFYFLSFFLAVLSCLSKPMAVTIPLILFLIDYFNNRKFSIKTLIDKIPFFIMAAVIGMIAFKFQVISGVTNVGTDQLVRIYFLAKEIPFYLAKTFFPVPLSAIYMFYNIGPQHKPELYFNIVLQIALISLAIYSSRFSKKFVFGGLFFILTLLPVLKLVPTGDVFAADRYMYVPSIGIFYILAVWLANIFFGNFKRTIKALVILIFLIWLSFLCVVTVNRCGIWKGSETFFLDILRQNPDIPTANNNLGGYYLQKRDYDKAIFYFKKTLSLDPSLSLKKMATYNLNAAEHKKELGI